MEIDYLKLAIDEAWKYQFLTYPNPAVGATIIINNHIFVNAHKKAGNPHAEIEVLWEAFKTFHKTPNLTTSQEIHEYLLKNHNNFFNNSQMYVTLEPCSHIGKTPSCANLLSILKPKKVIIGWFDPIATHSGGVDMLKKAKIEVEVLNDKRCYDLIEPFLKWQKRFIFFKFAFSLNGVYEGGYITKKETLKWVHKVRDKLDLIVIGGETVRTDRPTLDTRFIKNGKNPDILIYSKNKNFDKTIPLFNIPNRKVYISDNLDILNKYKFIMIEGGENLYKHLKNKIDWKVFMCNPNKFINKDNFKIEEEFETIYTKIDEDITIFGR